MNWSTASAAALFLMGAAAAVTAQQSAPTDAPPPGPGLELIQRSCVSCHDIYTIIDKRKSPAEWADTVGLMADRGANVTPDEMKVIEEYLAHNFASSGSTP